MKKHFAFISMPAVGHVNPTLPLVTELLRRGHRVSYAVGRELASAVETTGADVIELPTRMPETQRGQFGPEQTTAMIQFFVDDIRASFPILRQRFRADAPDAVCFDTMAIPGRMLVENLGLPGVALVSNFAFNEKFSLRDVIASDDAEFSAEAFAEFGQRIQQIGAEFGVRAE
ncbi:glycosyl transferase, partial [Saccharopolyspora sp. NPDC050389]